MRMPCGDAGHFHFARPGQADAALRAVIAMSCIKAVKVCPPGCSRHGIHMT